MKRIATTRSPARENVRNLILDAGINLLTQQGIAALTQPQIATAAGISQSHLTYYFPTRAKLHQGIAEHAMHLAFDSIKPKSATSPGDAGLITGLARIIDEGIPPRAMIGLVVAADGDPEIRKQLRKMIRKIRAAMQQKLEASGLQSGEEDTLLFHASLIGLAVMHLARQNKESEREVQSGLETLIRRMSKPGTAKKQEMP